MPGKNKRLRVQRSEQRRRHRIRVIAFIACSLVAFGVYFHYEAAIHYAEIISAIYGVAELLLDMFV